MSALLPNDVLIETLLWTAVLIGLVLILRRPVARHFGPQMAYALWAIPMLRLILPPLQLPAWMNPAPAAPETATLEPSGAGEPLAVLDPAMLTALQSPPASELTQVEAAASDGAFVPAPEAGFGFDPFVEPATLIELGLAIWLIGAAIFLYVRFAAYFRLRDDLLDGASEVGRAAIGKRAHVRLIETAGTNAPLAFGVIDKVIALPPGFLAQPDRQARDLALAHEMAHHEGRDLLANVLVQPLFAMHWWNPLGRYGWLALRRDQEAACDARVMAQIAQGRICDALPEAREAYANLIVSFAAAPNAAPHHALTAPMACPVLGDKSIIHRLRSLNMTETSNNRRLAGRLMLGAAVIALPLTASISYAANDAPMAPPAPDASVAPAPPAPPAAPLAPQAPEAPEAPSVEVSERIIIIDPDSDTSEFTSKDGENVFVLRSGKDGEREERIIRRWVERSEVSGGEGMSDEQIEEIMIEVREGLAEARAELENLPQIIEEAMAEAREARAEAMNSRDKAHAKAMSKRTIVEMKCDRNSDEVATTREGADGSKIVMLCQSRIMGHALEGLKEARKAIARNPEMSDSMRQSVISELDREIERWKKETK